MNTTSNHQDEMPSNEVAPSSQNGHSTGGLESSRGTELNAHLAQENAQLVQERDLLRMLIDNLPDNMFVKDRQSRFLINNLAHVRTLGATHPDEVLGKTDLDIFPAELAKQYYGDEQALMESGQPLDREETVVNPHTGEKRRLQTTKVPLRDKNGKVVGLIGINRDITDRKQAEEDLRRAHDELEKRVAERTVEISHERLMLRILIDNLPDLIFIKDAQSRFAIVNMACAQQLGASRPEDVLGKSDADFVAADLAAQYRADEQALMQSGQPVHKEEPTQHKGTGEMHWSLTSKIPMKREDGRIIGLIGIARDITERKRVEQALAHEGTLMRTLIDNLPDFIYAKDKQGRFVLNNMAHVQDLGAKSPEELKGKSDFDFFPPELARQFFADEQKIIETGQPMHGQEQYKCRPGDKSGKKYWSITSKVLWHDAQGKVLGTVGITRDTTEQRRTEAKLAYEQQLFQTLLETTPDNIYFKDRESRFVRVSQSKVESTLQTVRKTHRAAHPADNQDEWPPHLAGTKAFAEWLIGKTDFDTFQEDFARAAFEDEQEIIRTSQPIIGKLQKMTLPDGAITWSLVTEMPWRDKDGNIIGTFGVSRDVTKLKEAEESLDRERILLRTLIDNLPDFIYAKDKQGHFVLNNIAHAHDLGVKSPEEMKGKSDFDFFPPELAAQFYADEQKIIETGQPVYNQEQHKSRPGDKSGKKYWSVSTKVLWRDDQGAVLGTVGVTRDIHQMKLAQEALRQSEDKLRQFTVQLERSNRELQDFAYVASHDLQEPLRKIVVFGERLKEKNGPTMGPDALDYLDRMQKAAARMQILINDLLTFSRVTTKAQPFASVNLAEVASGVVDDLEGRIELVKGRVEVGALPVIDAEPLQMRQLLQNLIGNALKFRRPEEPPLVKVEAQIIPDPAAPENKLCRLTVSDNCIGFDEKYLDRIFNVFQRLHTRNEYEGTGMGLAIVRKIALYHGGDITAKSKLGEGSTFILTIPAAHPKEETQAENINQ
jgi:PAS domain S-box-containing protein